MTTCWICGEDGTTGEHKTKRSDLISVFGEVTQLKPLYLNSPKYKNLPIRSVDSKFLKSHGRICPKCNNSLSQPYDRAWEHMSKFLREHTPPLELGSSVRIKRIFPIDSAQRMLDVHLYFVKLFGCHIAESEAPIDIDGLAKAFRTGTAHPNIYIKFGYTPSMVGMSEMRLAVNATTKKAAFATWFYYVEKLAVNIMYAVDGERRDGLIDSWHPNKGRNKKIIMGDFIHVT
jgi:hypothetical protein